MFSCKTLRLYLAEAFFVSLVQEVVSKLVYAHKLFQTVLATALFK